MASASWLERVRAALAPKGYDVVRELASGGQGTVFLARQRSLERPVAIKIIRPELYTALAAERFLREAKHLASLSHPNIVPVHEADEADGMPYYVMDYLEGETVAHRLLRGPLPPEAARKLGRDLLAALEAAHQRGIVHRDVKPANVFLVNERAVLVDFGIAKRVAAAEQGTPETGPLTAPGPPPGTALYMAPEQLRSLEATPRSDLYSAALVIYEAYNAPHRFDPEQLGRRAWREVPFRVARVLRRALDERPERRWPDAASFRHALWRTRIIPYVVRTILLTAGALVLGLVGRRPLEDLIARVLDLDHGPPRVQISPFAVSAPPAERWVGDSMPCALSGALGNYPDLVVKGPCDVPFSRWQRKKTVLEGQMHATGDMIHVIVGPRGGPWHVAASIPVALWRGGASDLAAAIVDSLLHAAARVLDPVTPAVLPKTPAAKKAFLDAEHLFAQALWGEAYAAYGRAAAADTTCWICYWRHEEVGRWVGRERHDTSVIGRYLAHIGEFPQHYQNLIRADTSRLAARFELLERVTKRWPDFLFGQFRYADELVHRGPLLGHARREAAVPFQAVFRIHPDFGPAWEHLAWIHIAEGDSAQAARALERYLATGASGDPYTAGLQALLRLAFAWRFSPEEEARQVTVQVTQLAESAGVTNLDAGARMLPHFGNPRGAIAFARLLEARPSLERSALIAQTFGYLGLGRPDSARLALRQLGDRYQDASLGLFARELDAVLLFLDDDSARAAARWPAARQALDEYVSLKVASPEARRRAAWMQSLVALRFGGGVESRRYRAPLAEEPLPRPLTKFLTALDWAASGRVQRALEASEPLTLLEPGRGGDSDPFLLTLLHLARAAWYQRLPGGRGGGGGGGAAANARRELLWYEQSDMVGYPTGDPQPMEVDWAFGALAAWRTARLLEAKGDADPELCRAYRAVLRHWTGGEGGYAERADTAGRRLAELHCGAV